MITVLYRINHIISSDHVKAVINSTLQNQAIISRIPRGSRFEMASSEVSPKFQNIKSRRTKLPTYLTVLVLHVLFSWLEKINGSSWV